MANVNAHEVYELTADDKSRIRLALTAEANEYDAAALRAKLQHDDTSYAYNVGERHRLELLRDRFWGTSSVTITYG